MLLRLFSSTRSISVILIFLFTAILWLPSFLDSGAPPISQSESMILYSFIEGFLANNLFLSKVLAIIFLLFQSYLLILISEKYILLQHRNFFPALFFLLIASFYPGLQHFSAALIGSLFLIICINFFFETYDKDSLSYRFFDSGLILGLGSLFYAKLVLFLPVIWIAAIILRKMDWRELVMPVLGVALPLFVVVGIDFLRDEYPWQIFLLLKENIVVAQIPLVTNFGFWFINGILLLTIMISSIYMQKIFQFRKIFIRNYYLVFFWIFVISLAVFVIFSSFDMGIAYIISIPVAFILSNYFYNARKTLGNRLLFGMILLVFIFNGVNQIFGWV